MSSVVFLRALRKNAANALLFVFRAFDFVSYLVVQRSPVKVVVKVFFEVPSIVVFCHFKA